MVFRVEGKCFEVYYYLVLNIPQNDNSICVVSSFIHSFIYSKCLQVVHNFIRCCNKQLVQPLALSAVQCMGEVRLASETRESDHKYKNNSKIEVCLFYCYLHFMVVLFGFLFYICKELSLYI